MAGVYQPRSRGAAMSDALAEARSALARLLQLALLRGAGLLVLLATLAMGIALATYSSSDPSLNNATGKATSNWLGPLGATAADMLLQAFGIAAFAFVAPLAVWGARAVAGRGLSHAIWRAVAWPLGTVLIAAGLGVLPRPETLPAGAGGWIGIAAASLSAHAGHVWGQDWIGFALPLLLLAAGLPLAFIATGLRFSKLARALGTGAAALYWAGSKVRWPERRVAHDYDEEDEEPFEAEAEAPDDDAYHLDIAPEPIAATRLAERRETRVKRDEARKQAKAARPRQAALNLGSGEYQLPSLGLLNEPPHVGDTASLSDEALEENARMLEAVLADFGVKGRIVAVRPGPVVTLYEFEPAAGVKSSRVISLADDVARSMSAVAARIATIPGRNVIGIELPNIHRETVYLREMLSCGEYEKARAPLTLALGKSIGGEPIVADLAKMPHLLIAGTTGSGKSVGINTMILSLLYRMPPEHCRLIMIDPKMLELSVYEGIPHLLAPVVTEPRKAVVALKWAVREMEERYRKMSKLGVRGVEAFNDRVRKAKDKGDVLKRTVQTGFDRETGKPVYEDETLELEPMPYIVVVVDEGRRSDDGLGQGDRRRGAAPGADGARRRHPSDRRDPAPLGRRHHRHHQGELPDPHLVPGHQQDRQPHHPGRAGRRAIAGRRRHALHDGGRPHPAHPRPLRHRPRGRGRRAVLEEPGHAGISRRRHRRARRARRRSLRADGLGRRQFRERRRSLRQGARARRPRAPRHHQLHPAPPADRLQPRRLADRAHGA